MQARGPLMIEHRLIERMLSVLKNVVANIDANTRYRGGGPEAPAIIAEKLRTLVDNFEKLKV